MDDRSTEERQRASILSNLLDREKELDAELGKLRPYSPIWWRKVGRAGELRMRRIELEQPPPAPAGGGRGRSMIDKGSRILVQCLMHSTKPGELIAATLRKVGSDTLALCPKCIVAGAELRDRIKAELTVDNMAEALEGAQGEKPSNSTTERRPSPPGTPPSPEAKFEEIRDDKPS